MHHYPWLEAYLLEKTGCVQQYKIEWASMRYLIGGKEFARTGEDKEGREIINLKLEPLRGEFLREHYEEIVPGYYANKTHWNSVDLNGSVPDDLMREMCDESYRLVLGGLTKKAQREILGE